MISFTVISWTVSLPSVLEYPIDRNRWSAIQSINQYQSIKLVNCYRLVSANGWPVDNHTKTLHWFLLIGSATLNRHTRYLSVHPLFLGSPGDEIGKTNSNPVFSTQRIYHVACVLELPTCPSWAFHVIMSMQDTWVEALLNIICIIIWQQLMPLLLAISLIAKVQLLLPEFFCEGTMRPLTDFSCL